MKLNKPNSTKGSDRSLKENLQRLDDAGINLGGNQSDDRQPKDEEKTPDTSEQQRTGNTDRSDRRL